MTDQLLPKRSRIVVQALLHAGVNAKVIELPDATRTAPEAAAALGCEVGAIARSLLFLADNEPVLVITSGQHRVDTNVLAAQIGASNIRVAPAKQVRAMTGQAIGGVSPLGHPAPIRTVVDESLRDYDTVWSAAGTPHTVVPLSFNQLMTITNGTVASVTGK